MCQPQVKRVRHTRVYKPGRALSNTLPWLRSTVRNGRRGAIGLASGMPTVVMHTRIPRRIAIPEPANHERSFCRAPVRERLFQPCDPMAPIIAAI
jgi:hypothetical protein